MFYSASLPPCCVAHFSEHGEFPTDPMCCTRHLKSHMIPVVVQPSTIVPYNPTSYGWYGGYGYNPCIPNFPTSYGYGYNPCIPNFPTSYGYGYVQQPCLPSPPSPPSPPTLPSQPNLRMQASFLTRPPHLDFNERTRTGRDRRPREMATETITVLKRPVVRRKSMPPVPNHRRPRSPPRSLSLTRGMPKLEEESSSSSSEDDEESSRSSSPPSPPSSSPPSSSSSSPPSQTSCIEHDNEVMRYADYVQWEWERERALCLGFDNMSLSSSSSSSSSSQPAEQDVKAEKKSGKTAEKKKTGRKAGKKKSGKGGKAEESKESAEEIDAFLDTAIMKQRRDMANRVYFHQTRLERTLQHMFCECFNSIFSVADPYEPLSKADKAVLLTKMFKRLNSDPQLLEDVRESGMGQIEQIPWVEKSKSVINMWRRFADTWPQSVEQLRGEATLMWHDDLKRATQLVELQFSPQKVFDYLFCRGTMHVTQLAFGWSETIHHQAVLKWMDGQKLPAFCGTCLLTIPETPHTPPTDCSCKLSFCNQFCLLAHSMNCLENYNETVHR